DITSSFAFTMGLASNYDVHTNTASNGLTVNQATLTITPDGGKSKTYGQTFSAFTGSVSGLQNGEMGTATYASTGAPATANVGSYDITSSFAFTTGLASNYDVHTNTASNGLTVNQATLTITPDGGKSKTYGQTFSAFTGTVSGLQNGEMGTASYASTGAPNTANVGSYDITSSFSFTTGLASNYDVHTNTATNGLTVGKATLTITPDGGKAKTLGETFTAFTGTVSGLVNGDGGTVNYSSVGAPAAAPVGVYDITSGFTFTSGLASNYDVHPNTAPHGLTVGYGVCSLYDQTKAVKQNATVPVKFYLCNAAGQDVSSSAIVVTAVSLTPTAGSSSAQVEDSGSANPDNNFRYDSTLGPSGGYIFNLSTKGVPSAMWKLTFTVSGASFGSYTLGFGVK
ncbi:MAG TPA: MBG domain-containing protein, partial [Vicinamibacterales bacterium]|nr:MBG domain-containing protein [Vicinamibacterales bacterium]